jgi:hypothetical protein
VPDISQPPEKEGHIIQQQVLISFNLRELGALHPTTGIGIPQPPGNEPTIRYYNRYLIPLNLQGEKVSHHPTAGI